MVRKNPVPFKVRDHDTADSRAILARTALVDEGRHGNRHRLDHARADHDARRRVLRQNWRGSRQG
jgi:hypothetical protein